MVSSILEVLESSFISSSQDEDKSSLKTVAIDVASQLLILPTAPSVQIHTTALLAALHNAKQVYHLHKVHSIKISNKNFNIIRIIAVLYILFRIIHCYHTYLSP